MLLAKNVSRRTITYDHFSVSARDTTFQDIWSFVMPLAQDYLKGSIKLTPLAPFVQLTLSATTLQVFDLRKQLGAATTYLLSRSVWYFVLFKFVI